MPSRLLTAPVAKVAKVPWHTCPLRDSNLRGKGEAGEEGEGNDLPV